MEDDLPNGLIFDNYVSEEYHRGMFGPVTISTLGVVPNGTGQRIGWWIGDVPAAPDSRVVALTYRAPCRRPVPGAARRTVLDGDALVNRRPCSPQPDRQGHGAADLSAGSLHLRPEPR